MQEPATGPELILQITKPDNLIEVCIFRGRNIPLKAGQDDQSLGALQSAVVVQFGTQAYSTQASRPTASPVWNESLQLVCSEAPEDLITLIFWGWPQSEALPKASERTFLGHIAVPASRVKDVGREEGWYDLRDKHGNLVSGPEGTTERWLVLLSRQRYSSPTTFRVLLFRAPKIRTTCSKGVTTCSTPMRSN